MIYLFIYYGFFQFSLRCVIEDYLSGLEFGTDEARTKNSHCFTGKNHWNSFQVPGNESDAIQP